MIRRSRILNELSVILKHISVAVGSQRSTVYILNKEGNTVESIIAQGIEKIILSIPIGAGIVGHVAKTGSCVITNDAQSHELFDPTYDQLLNFCTESVICTPILNSHNEIIGALQAINKNGRYDHHDLTILRSFSSTLYLIIKNATLYHTNESIKNEISILLEVSNTVSSELNLDKLIQIVINKACEITCADRSSLFLKDESTDNLWTKYAMGIEGVEIRTKGGIVGKVAATKKPYITNNPYSDMHFENSHDQKLIM